MEKENIENTIIDGNTVTIIIETENNKIIFNNDKLEWHTGCLYSQYLTLNEILEQLEEMDYKSGVITVWQETPLYGEIYQYGNHCPTNWIKIGQTIGYV